MLKLSTTTNVKQKSKSKKQKDHLSKTMVTKVATITKNVMTTTK